MEPGLYSVTCVHARSSAYLLVLSGPIGGTLGRVLYGDFPSGRRFNLLGQHCMLSASYP